MESGPAPVVEIHYTRPPGRVTVFRQHLVHRTTECVVTLLERAGIPKPVTVRGAIVLEPHSPVVWFTFPGAWHDIGRFHTSAGDFTGYYANILTPVHFATPLKWQTTDMFLDVWLDEDGTELLDEDELEAALRSGDVAHDAARRARAEADTLLSGAAAGTWPPAVCREWTLERARSRVRDPRGTRDAGPV